MDFAAACARYLEYLRVERNCSEHTQRNYASDLEQFRDFLRGRPGRELAIEALTHLDIRSFLGELYAARLTSTSIARKLAVLRSLFRFLAREGFIADNPARLVTSPKLPKTLPAVPTAEEVNTFLDALPAMAAAGSSRAKPDARDGDAGWLRLRDRAILEMLYGCGVRVGELVGLDMDHVDRRGGLLRVRGKGRKERLVPLGRKADAALETYLEARAAIASAVGIPHATAATARRLSSERAGSPRFQASSHGHGRRARALFVNHRGGRLTTRSVARLVKRYALLAGADTGLHPHSFRHAYATHLLSDGADLRAIQELLGHARLCTTQKYTHTNIKQLMEVYDRSHPKA